MLDLVRPDGPEEPMGEKRDHLLRADAVAVGEMREDVVRQFAVEGA
jgi:hypothetical protein